MTATKLSISVSGVTLARGGRTLFQNVTFAVPQGSALLLTGANGAGKTSLLRSIAGALPVTAGKIETYSAKPAAFLPADDALWQNAATVIDALSFWGRLSGGDAEKALRDAGLSDLSSAPVRLLSAGQKRKLSLARVIVQNADLWLLDEPLTALDANARRVFAQLVQGHLSAGGAAVIASHEELPAGFSFDVLKLAAA